MNTNTEVCFKAYSSRKSAERYIAKYVANGSTFNFRIIEINSNYFLVVA